MKIFYLLALSFFWITLFWCQRKEITINATKNNIIFSDQNMFCIDKSSMITSWNNLPLLWAKYFFVCIENNLSDQKNHESINIQLPILWNHWTEPKYLTIENVISPTISSEFQERENAIFNSLTGSYTGENTFILFAMWPKQKVDLANFEFINEYYAKDSDNLYVWWWKFDRSVDLNSIKIIDERLFKDKNHVFFDKQIVTGCDSESFEYLNENYYWKDKNHVYYFWGILTGVSPNNFHIDNKQWNIWF